MKTERFRLLAAAIAAHPNRQVVGRTRLQKTIKLLQRLGFPTDYDYMLHFYGPYSEGLQAEIGLLEHLGLLKEKVGYTSDGLRSYYIIEAKPEAKLDEVEDKFGETIKVIASTESVVLELAATYDALREAGMTHEEALDIVRMKKGSKCDDGNMEEALALLEYLGLPTQ